MLTDDLHRHLHWAAIRTICRNPRLKPSERRAKLRFFLEGLSRHRGRVVAA